MGREERSHIGSQGQQPTSPPSSSLPPPQIEELVCTNEQRTNQWEGFRGWLERRGKQRYNVIIDGANVGYYKACLSEGELADLRQVDWAVKKFQEEGKKPLVVLHSRHLVEKRLSDEAKEIYKRRSVRTLFL
ncbi:conserved unknown protein [Ectocarpus siliculosus]|uniref:Uncharacterized protein n=1 Tax=Ectocarpus siliculosus TaxID=2880 RepID=D7FNK7_ECTSI|nr:conserved unknown protein [Ectocarpus siliculosus]|eukprot:CBJ26018.1 conserved unknown protein [Ectocarpus siliculosus]